MAKVRKRSIAFALDYSPTSLKTQPLIRDSPESFENKYAFGVLRRRNMVSKL